MWAPASKFSSKHPKAVRGFQITVVAIVAYYVVKGIATLAVGYHIRHQNNQHTQAINKVFGNYPDGLPVAEGKGWLKRPHIPRPIINDIQDVANDLTNTKTSRQTRKGITYELLPDISGALPTSNPPEGDCFNFFLQASVGAETAAVARFQVCRFDRKVTRTLHIP